MPKVRYVRNLTPNSVRIDTISLNPRGGRDVAEVSEEVFQNAKFAPSVGLLVEEITKAEYQQRISSEWHEPAKVSRQKEIFHVDSSGKERKLPVEMEIEQDAVRVPVDSAGFAGAERVMGSRPDDGAGKTLSEMRGEDISSGDEINAELGI